VTPAAKLVDGLQRGADGVVRCWWCGSADDYVRYHDVEWAVPVVDNVRLFEKLSLEGFQAGLSWITILRKRARFREVFADFVPERIARFGARDVARLLKDPGIVRHRGKIEAVIANARALLEMQDRGESFATFVWRFAPVEAHRPQRRADIQPLSAESTALSKELKRRGWKFVGPTTVHAFFQAMGLVNDHVVGCARREPVEALRTRALRSL
jgi:DNA-3-methyladenine glycosylase I